LASLADDKANSVLEKADFLFIANKKFLEIAQKKYPNKKLYLTEDGVDLQLFKGEKILPDEILKFIWVGNSTHGNNDEKTFDLKGYQKILLPLSHYIKQKGGEFIFLDRASGKIIEHNKMAEWYNKATCYVCASSAEGTPNGILEAAACGRASITTDVGLVPELIKDKYNGLIVNRNLNDFKIAVDWMFEHKKEVLKMCSNASKEIKKFDWKLKTKDYCNMFDSEFETLQNLSLKNSRAINTEAFLISVGAPQKNESLKCLRCQKSDLKIRFINNISPMHQAFQKMINESNLNYFIQVDEDMLLNSNAAERMIQAMKAAKENVAMIVFPLWDTHLQEIIQGVKIYRTSAMKKIKFEDSYSCEIPILKKLKDLGYCYVKKPLEDKYILGKHEIGDNPKVIYERYLRLAQKYKKFKYIWIPEAMNKIKERIKCNKCDPRDPWAIAGFTAGTVLPIQEDTEADYKKMPEGFANLIDVFGGDEL